MHDDTISSRLPSERARRQQIHDDARNRRTLLKLVGADCADLIGLHADAFMLRVEPGIWQINHHTVGVSNGLN